jgi:hypothetical protein
MHQLILTIDVALMAVEKKKRCTIYFIKVILTTQMKGRDREVTGLKKTSKDQS